MNHWDVLQVVGFCMLFWALWMWIEPIDIPQAINKPRLPSVGNFAPSNSVSTGSVCNAQVAVSEDGTTLSIVVDKDGYVKDMVFKGIKVPNMTGPSKLTVSVKAK